MEKALFVLTVLAVALTVRGEVLKFEHNVTVEEGKNTELRCRTNGISNYGATVIYWVRSTDARTITYRDELSDIGDDKEEPGEIARYSLDLNTPDEYTIRITDAKVMDTGKWVCTSDNSEEVWLTVRVPPKIIYHTPDIITQRNKSHSLICRAEGHPPPVITWSRLGNTLPNGDILFHGQELELINMTSNDRGTYHCVASNTVGIDSADVNIVMRYKPEVLVMKPEVKAYVNGRATLVCEYHANPEVSEVVWYRAGRRIDEDRKLDVKIFTNTAISTLVFGRVRSDQWGQYECKVRNPEGTVSKLVEFSEGRPEATPLSERVRSAAAAPTSPLVAMVMALIATVYRL